jgi:predicted nucleotidyltransferase
VKSNDGLSNDGSSGSARPWTSSRFGFSVRAPGGRAAGEDSDIDLLVITRGDPERDRSRTWALIDEVARELRANPAPYVPQTWDRAWLENRRAIDSFFVKDLDRDRIVLFGDP